MKKYIILLVLVLFLPILFYVFSRDAAVYAYMGALFFDGKTPYIDGWDHKGITLYLINAFGYLIGFKNYIGIRFLEIILILFSFISVYKSLLFKYSEKIAFLAVSFGLLSLSYFFDGGNLTEEYGAIFTLVALSLFLKEDKKTIHYLVIGALFVVNFTIRANLISFWIALFLALTVSNFIKKDRITVLVQSYLKIGLGILIGTLPLGIYFLITDSFTEFYNAAFTYNFSYAKQSFGSIIGYVIKSTRIYEVSLIMILALLISGLFIIKKKTSSVSILLFFWIPLELYFSNMSGKGFAHYYMIWVPIIVLSTAFVAYYFKLELISKEKRIIVVLITAFLFFQIPIFNTITTYKNLFVSKKSKNELIASYINENYKSQSILVWGNESVIYNLTNKRATVTNFYQTLFKLNSSLTKIMIINFTSQIKQNPPELIIDVRTPSLLFLDASNSNLIDKIQQENLSIFFAFVNQNYIKVATKSGADFYMKKS